MPPGSPPDPAVVRRGASFASALIDTRQKGHVWGLLFDASSSAFPALLAEALAAEGSEARLMLTRTWAIEYVDEAPVRAALQNIADTDPEADTRAAAEQLLVVSGT